MFEINLLNGDNNDDNQLYKFYWEESLLIGFNQDCDLILKLDQHIKDQLFITINNNELYIKSDKIFILINNKRFKGVKRINLNDKISFLNYKFKFTQYSKFKEINIKEKYNSFIKSEPIYDNLIKGLQKELIFIEGKINSEINS